MDVCSKTNFYWLKRSGIPANQGTCHSSSSWIPQEAYILHEAYQRQFVHANLKNLTTDSMKIALCIFRGMSESNHN